MVVARQPGHPKTKCLQKRSHFIDPEESPIKCTLCGKGGYNHRICPNVSLLGQDQLHRTRQSQGQLQATVHHDQTKCPKPAYETMGRSERRSYNKQNVHAVMMPMSQPVGGGHVTSMTGQSRLTMTKHMSHNQRDKRIA